MAKANGGYRREKKNPLRRAGFWTVLTAGALAGGTHLADGLERYAKNRVDAEIDKKVKGYPCFIQPFIGKPKPKTVEKHIEKAANKSKAYGTLYRAGKPIYKGYRRYRSLSPDIKNYDRTYLGAGLAGGVWWGLGAMADAWKKGRRRYG
jgi:hypothetical protein